MRTSIRKVGNSQGIIIPKALLDQLGFDREAEMSVEDEALVIRKPNAKPRAGWAEASRRLARAQDDVPVWPDFGNEADADLAW